MVEEEEEREQRDERMKLLGAHTFSDAAWNGGQARSRRLGRLRVLAGFPLREIKKGRRPSARGSRAKIIKTRARFAAAASLLARSRRSISGYTRVDGGYPVCPPLVGLVSFAGGC